MPLYVFDLNDSQLRIMRGSEVVAETTGYALLTEREVLMGEAARDKARLHPRQANSQFWDRMSVDPLPVVGKNASNHADLVYQQLRELLGQAGVSGSDDVVVAAPGNFTPEQLSLFLGIAQELDVRVCGLVDAAVAATCIQPAPQLAWHLDVGLHRATLSMLETNADQSRKRAEALTELGLLRILDSLVNVVADRFVSETRYDPLRIAATEQQLFDQISSWAAAPNRPDDLVIEVRHEGTQRRVDIAAARLIEKAAQRYQLLGGHLKGGDTVFLSHRAASLPGLTAYLTGMDVLTSVLSPTALAIGIETHANLIVSDPDQLRFVTRLPSAGKLDEVPVDLSATVPTHVVCGDELLAIPRNGRLKVRAFAGAEGAGLTDDLTLAFKDGALTLAGSGSVTVNGNPASAGQPLRRGDRLAMNGIELTLVKLIDET